jgi:hypothetical protein
MAHNAGDAAKAYRLRKALKDGKTLMPTEVLWLGDYERRTGGNTGTLPPGSTGAAAKAQPYGRSRKARKVNATFNLEEAAEAEGGGDSPAMIAAAAALQERAAGERLDALTVNSLNVLKEAVLTYRRLCTSVTEMLAVYQQSHLDTLASVREHYLARTKAEADTFAALKQAEDSGDPAKEMMLMVLMKHLGIELPAGMNGAPRPNGAGKKQ